MKLSTVTAKLTCAARNLNGKLGGKTTGVLAGLVLAGAALITVPAAHAQRFAVGVQFGGPRYYAPAPRYVGPAYGYGYGYAPGYWQHRRYEDWRRHEFYAHHYGYYGPRY